MRSTREGLDVTVAGGLQTCPQAADGSDLFRRRDRQRRAARAAWTTCAHAGAGELRARPGRRPDLRRGRDDLRRSPGFSGSALEKVLPVEFKAQEKRKDLALVVCLDRSYSMKGRPMELAKAGTRAALASARGAAPLRRDRLRLAAARRRAAASSCAASAARRI